MRSARLMGDTLPVGVFRLGDLEAPQVSPQSHLSVASLQARADPDLDLASGDIVHIGDRQDLQIIFRHNEEDPCLFLGERCQNHCIFCSQPPRNVDDSHWVQEALMAIPLLPSSAKSLGISGGEPTLNPKGLLDVLAAIQAHHPDLPIQLLSNGRQFAYLGLAQALTSIGLSSLLVGVPLHAEVPFLHDALAGSPGAWGETVRGIFNLARCGIPIEVRVVICKSNADRLDRIAEWVGRNLPFVSHVAFMGLEITGLARKNHHVWIAPEQYQPILRTALRRLRACGIPASIYNFPLCHLDQDLWPWSAATAISTWKRGFGPKCEICTEKTRCGGVFTTGTRLQPLPHLANTW